MTVDDLRTFYESKSDADLARKLNKDRSVIWYWRKQGIAPRTQATFEILSNGKLKADLKALEA